MLSSHLADAHHQVRMLVATSVERYAADQRTRTSAGIQTPLTSTCMSRFFLEVGPDRKMLPLKQQQEAFEHVYLRAQEGMLLPVSLRARGGPRTPGGVLQRSSSPPRRRRTAPRTTSGTSPPTARRPC